MNSICLSVAPNLRCQGLSRIENIILAVPPAVEAIFSLTLAFTNSSIRGRKRWLLVCDGLSFFLLVLADALAHLLPQISSSSSIFTIVDFVIAGASFLPILAYTLFLVLFSRANLVTSIPSRFSRVIIVTLFILIPFIIASSEVGSLLGIMHTTFQLTNLTPVTGIQFSNVTFRNIASFLSFASVTLLTLFQATHFVLSFVRVIRALSDARRAEGTGTQTSEGGQDQVHLFRGLGWVCAGLKLGAIETAIGFVDINFGVAVTRRALRLFSRGSLIIGVIKGMNIVEDFNQWKTIKDESPTSSGTSQENVEKVAGPSRIEPSMISGPRNSTFYQMSPTASQFHAAHSQKKIRKPGPSPLVLGAESSFNRFKNINPASTSVTSQSRMGGRVTVRYDGKTPPVLDLRMSTFGLNFPSLPKMPDRALLATVMEEPQENPVSAPGVSFMPRPVVVPQTTPTHPMYAMPPTKPASALTAADSVEALNELAGRFPNLPPRLRPGQPVPSGYDSRRDSDAEWRMVARARSLQRRQLLEMDQVENKLVHTDSIKRKPVPPANPVVIPPSPASTVPSDYGPDADQDVEYERPRKAPTPPLSHPAMFSPTSSDEGTLSRRTSGEITPRIVPSLTRASTLEVLSPFTPPSAAILSAGPLLERKIKQRARASQGFAFVPPQSPPRVETLPERRQRRLSQMRQQLRIMPTPQESRLPEKRVEQGMGGWLRNNGPLYELQSMGRPADDDAVDEEAIIDEAWQRAGLSRIKSVTRVPVHTTPRVQQQMFDVRSSLIAEAEEEMEDLDLPGLPSSYDHRRESVITASLKRPARSDSGVFSEEERRWVRQGIYR